jgi:hypothetical protein|tara:strand:+ start:265 stop:939 length:675 start_codon:yes stop_codon:yes gene_type:complete
MSKICIHHCSGSGGSFLTSMIGRMLDIDEVNFIDIKHGDYHQNSKGEWGNFINKEIASIGNHWQDRKMPAKIYYTHQHDYVSKLQTLFHNLKVIAIDADVDDFALITTMFIKKAWVNMWTEQEYNRWVKLGCNFPPYHISNLEDPDVFDVIHEQLNTDTIEWHQQLVNYKIDYTIKFKTIFGLDETSLVHTLETVMNKPVNNTIEQLITQYQQRNKELYFNARL